MNSARCRSLRSWWFVGMTCLTFGCADPAQVHTACDGLIHGEDTRRDVHAVENAEMARLAVQSTLAFMSAEHLVNTAEGTFEIISETLGEANHLCPDEAFVAQPAAATCSGVLVDDQLVLTAGHCIPDDATCPDQMLVFGYAITDPASALALEGDALHRCKSVPFRRHGLDSDGRRWDHAFIELDRPVSAARYPVQVATEALPAGSDVTVIGYPSGLPVKVDSGVEILHTSPCRDYFTINSDTFQASSGSGVFDERGRLAGIFARGGVDYEFLPEMGCAVARQIASVEDCSQAEQASHVAPAIAALCATGWVSTRLCATSRSADLSGQATDRRQRR